jgi:hypothetical protein
MAIAIPIRLRLVKISLYNKMPKIVVVTTIPTLVRGKIKYDLSIK